MKHLKKALCLLLCAALCAALSVCVFAQDASTWGDVRQDNFIRITSADAWNQGTLENLEVAADVGDGALRLAAGQTEGVWTSPELDVPAFEYLVASWGADTPDGTWVEIKARAYVDMYDQWSGWLSWGKWGTSVKRGSADTSETLAEVDTDTLIILGSKGETSSRIQLMAVLHSDDAAVTPTLRQVCTTSKNTLEGQAIPTYHPNAGMELPEKVLLDTPCYSQMIRDSAIGSVICSPTSMTMLLNDRNSALDLLPEEVALREFDFNYQGFGNWPFTVAAAGAYGYSAYCHYADLDFVREELACGRSVAMSVRYSSRTTGNNPYLENGAAGDTSGHLIVIVGYETIDGVDYFYSNDSAATGDASCAHRRYRADQLETAWSGRLAYVVSAEPEQNAGQDAPVRVPATLEYTGDKDAYRLMVDGQEVVLNKSFGAKTSRLDAGTVLVITDKSETAQLPDPVEPTTANQSMIYCSVNGDGQIYINSAKIESLGAQTGTCYIIVNNGPTYVASVEFPAPAAPAEPETPAEPEAPAEPETPAEPQQNEEAPRSAATPLIIVAVCAVVLAVLAVVLKKKHK